MREFKSQQIATQEPSVSLYVNTIHRRLLTLESRWSRRLNHIVRSLVKLTKGLARFSDTVCHL